MENFNYPDLSKIKNSKAMGIVRVGRHIKGILLKALGFKGANIFAEFRSRRRGTKLFLWQSAANAQALKKFVGPEKLMFDTWQKFYIFQNILIRHHCPTHPQTNTKEFLRLVYDT